MSDWIDVYGAGSDTEFSVETGDLSKLEIRQSPNNQTFHYFYDTEQRRLVTDFVLHDGAQVSTLCTVTLIFNEGKYSPRLKLWKKDKRPGGRNAVVEYDATDEPRAHMIKASVDVRQGHENLWKLTNFLQGCQRHFGATGRLQVG